MQVEAPQNLSMPFEGRDQRQSSRGLAIDRAADRVTGERREGIAGHASRSSAEPLRPQPGMAVTYLESEDPDAVRALAAAVDAPLPGVRLLVFKRIAHALTLTAGATGDTREAQAVALAALSTARMPAETGSAAAEPARPAAQPVATDRTDVERSSAPASAAGAGPEAAADEDARDSQRTATDADAEPAQARAGTGTAVPPTDDRGRDEAAGLLDRDVEEARAAARLLAELTARGDVNARAPIDLRI